MTKEDRARIATELDELYGQAIETMSKDLYLMKPTVIGIALAYFDCGCVSLRGFDESGEIVGHHMISAADESCTVDHTKILDNTKESTQYSSILWKDSDEDFDRKYGNEKRIDIASKLFPPPELSGQ